MTDTMTDTTTPGADTPTTGHQVVVYPSMAVRPIPSFVFAAPPGWVVDEAPGALCAIRVIEAKDGFWSNALLTHDRVAKGVDLQAVASASWGRLKADAPSAEVAMERVARFGRNIVYLRGVELDAPQSGNKLAQLHAIFFAPTREGDKTLDLFQFVATSTPATMEDVAKSFVEMIATFNFV